MSDGKEKEKEILERERKAHPELFVREPAVDSSEWMAHIGIENVFENYPIGYIRYLPQDFVVEEISLDRTLHTVDPGPLFQEPIGKGRLWEGELVKIDRSTLEAKDEIASLLGISQAAIGWAGIKDRFAITSQLVSFSGIPDPQMFTKLSSAEHFFLKNLKKGQNVITNGKLWSNRFIVTVRTTEPINAQEQKRIEKHIQEITEDGFWNFFSFQRFGIPRLNSHITGKFLFEGAYEKAVQSFFTYLSPREIPYFQAIRKETEKHWGDWAYIKELMEPFPSQFPSELKILEHLCRNPMDFLGALKTIPDQIRLWVYAYASYLFNKKLSEFIKQGEVPFTLPLITSHLSPTLRKDFPFILPAREERPTLQKVEVQEIKLKDKLAVLAFSLRKGAYATTFLAHFFQLASHLPIVPGISTQEVDAKEMLGIGSLKDTLERFASALNRIKEERASLWQES